MDDDLPLPLYIQDAGRYVDDESTDTSDDETIDNESGEQASRRSCPNVSYDTSLPAQHSYLGTDLEELSGRTVLDDNSCQTIPLLALPGVVLVPGQTLPLQLYHPATVSMMMHIINNDRTFGLINSRFSGRTFGGLIDAIGTTAEIRSYREEGEETYGLIMLRILAEGRQRFRLLETRRQHDGMTIAKVCILPEIVLGDPGLGAKLSSLDRYRLPPPRPLPIADEKSDSQCGKQCDRKCDKYNFANYTQWPKFVYKQYDPVVLMNKLKDELQGWNDSLKSDYMPLEPREFSYWVAANLPLDDNQRISLLSLNNDIQRLRKEIHIIEQCSVLRCRDCHNDIADRKDIFSMSLKGPQGTYVNPNGYVHEAITLYNTKGLILVGRQSTEHSWFPGYAWKIVECSQCHTHMGWKFISLSKKLQPAKFWALCRSALSTEIQSGFADFSQESP